MAESTQRLSEEIRGKYEVVDWRGIAGFRNVLVHDYMGIDLPYVWGVIERDLPALRRAVDEMLEDLS